MTKKYNATRIFLLPFSGALLIASAWGFSAHAQQQYNIGNVSGQSLNVNIGDVTGGTDINITGNRGYVDWRNLGIGNAQTANFQFDGQNGAILNRVANGVTEINGRLNSNGTVYIVNPNGLTIGPSGVINAQGFVGSTAATSDEQLNAWMNGSNDLGTINSGVINHRGKIIANSVQLESAVINTSGIIRANAIDADHQGRIYLRATNGNININSSVIATIGGGNIDVQADAGDVNFGIDSNADPSSNSTLVNAYDNGHVTITGKSVNLVSNVPNAYISVGANKGTTTVTTTSGDLTLQALNGGYAQIGYHFRDTDSRIYNQTAANSEDSLFSGFTFNDTSNDAREDHERLANLYLPSGDIDVQVNGGDLIIQAAYRESSDVENAPAAHIGHAYLAKDKETGKIITLYQYIPPTDSGGGYYIPLTNTVSGNINVQTPDGDIRILSEGTSIARIGHHVRNFVSPYYIRDANFVLPDEDLTVNKIYGDISAHSGRDVVIRADGGGTSGIGHVGEDFNQNATNGSVDHYDVTASRDIILQANGTRDYGNNNAWKSIAQIGSNIMGKAVFAGNVNTANKNTAYVGAEINANITALSGVNMILQDANGGTSAIGHANNSEAPLFYPGASETSQYRYGGRVIVGYSFNRYKNLDERYLAEALGTDPALYKQYQESLKSRFNGNEEGYLAVDGNSRIGKEFVSYEEKPSANNQRMFVGIFGFRKMQNGTDDAIRFADGAIIGNGIMDSGLPPGTSVPESGTFFRYNIDEYPGDGTITAYAGDDSRVEYYGYAYAQYQANRREHEGVFGYLAPNDVGKYGENTVRIFYASTKPEPEKPPYVPPIPPNPPGPPERPEKPRYPWFPAWYEPIVCCKPIDPCQVETTCREYIPKACEPALPACKPNHSASNPAGTNVGK
ncbi:MAG: filamentous hemagglutinin N-terminal domain-containing protein [Planctomycetaceae bacterium]|jgi:filamentous hemagglutinin family protein|nr:filamentous hemagglutinin N-terminal domain-containing protein [Planctomycetaceae bacterium]